MAKKTNVPEIRFAGFTDPWEQRKLGEIAPVTMGQSPNGACYTDNPNDVVLVQGNADLKDGWVSPRVWTTEITKTAKSGDLIMSVRAPVGAMGKTAYDVVLGRGVAGIVGNEFLFQALSKKEAEGYWSTVSAGSTFDSINGDELRSTPIDCPRSETECEAIGNCLSKVDHLITLHQRKYDKLCAVKKSMLDKIFPKPGEVEPEIRFAGFTDPWEQRKLGDVATIVGGGTPSTNNDAYWDGDIDWYSPAELGEQVYADRSVRRITQAGYDSCSATLLPAGKTILFTSRAGIGNTAILRRSACTNQGFQSLVMNDDIDVYFIYSMTDRIKKFAEQKASGSTFLEISGKGLAAGEFAFPSKDEQTAIGSMFKQLDHLITLHQRELNLLKNTKKSLLDKMFV